MATKPIFRVVDVPPDATTAQIWGRELNLTLDVRDFKGRAGMPWLIMAAKVHLSINDLLEVMAAYGYERTRSWVSRRRWIFLDPDDVRTAGAPRNADGQEANIQHKILRVLEMQGPLKKGRLQDFTNAGRVATELWNRALEGLIRDGRVGKRPCPSRSHPEGCLYYLAARN